MSLLIYDQDRWTIGGEERLKLLGGDTHSLTTATGSLGVLTTDSKTPRMTETTMDTNLFHALKVLTKLVVQVVGKEVGVLAILNILLTIEEPVWDLVLARILHNGDNALKISLVEFTSTNKELGTLATAIHLGNI